MHTRRLACLFLGIWLAGGFFMAFLATQNFAGVDRLLEEPSSAASLDIHALGAAEARLLLRYQVSEQNRFYFETWEMFQLVWGAGFFFYLLFGTREDGKALLLALAMLLIVVAQRLVLTPEITGFGRILDFLPAQVYSPARKRFWLLHGVYTGVEVGKWALGCLLAFRLVWRRRRSRSANDAREQLNLINKANYRHIDR